MQARFFGRNLISTEVAAAMIGCSVQLLRAWSSKKTKGRILPKEKHGQMLFYDTAEVEKFAPVYRDKIRRKR